MTIFDFTAFTTNFDMTISENADAAVMQGLGSTSGDTYLQWRTTFFTVVRGFSEDLVLDGSGVPTAGTYTAIQMFLGGSILELTGLSIAATDFSYTSGEAAADQFWARILEGDTTFILNDQFGLAAYGDRRVLSSGTLDGSDDTFTGSPIGNSDLHGDTRIVNGGTLNGGDDVFNVTAFEVYGDTETVSGATVNGGNDTITFTEDWAFTRLYVFGEADIVSTSNIFCGNDTIDVSLVVSTTIENVISGDAFNVGGVSTFDGGDDIITGSQAVDTIYGDLNSVSVGGVLTGGDDIIDGQGGNDRIFGDVDESRSNGTIIGGNDIIDGGGGGDIIKGNAGNDLITGGAGDDELDGGSGSDTASYSDAAAGVTVSLLVQDTQQDTIGAGVDFLTQFENLTGSAHADTLTGNAVSNLLDGGASDDTLTGGNGDDFLIGGTGGDTLSGGGGVDTISYEASSAAVTITLSNQSAAGGDAQNDTISGIENAVGSGFGDRLTGNSLANVLTGGGGSDQLNSGNGNDTLLGGIGNDVLIGGGGSDNMFGGNGKDRFDFNSALHSGSAAAARDIIGDFTLVKAVSAAFIDRIDLSNIDAIGATPENDAFSFIGGGNFTGEGQIRAVQAGSSTVVTINISGDLEPEMRILLRNVTATDLSAVDFIL